MKRFFITLFALLTMLTGANAQDMTATPLTFEAVEDGTISVTWSEWSTPSLDVIQYKLNDSSWTDVTWNSPISLVANDVISFRGDNGTCYNEEVWDGFHLECSNDCYVYGNVMSLIDQDGFATNTTLSKTYAFYQLFMRADFQPNTTIKNHPTKDIVLPATTLTVNCYDAMFMSCKGITRAPALPATTLTEWCYNAMFMDCTALTSAPELPAITLANACYADMFMGCTALTTAPDLPATTLVEGCYTEMFTGCTSLNYVKCLATDISADYCTLNWLGEVAATGTFVKDASINDWPVGPDANDQINGIPTGWTVEDYSAKTPYAVLCGTNYYYLFFTNRSEKLEVGDTFTPEGTTNPQTITDLWSGDEVTNYQGAPGWYSLTQASRIFALYIEPSFQDVKPKNGRAWFQGLSKLLIFDGLNYLDTSEMTDMGFMFSGCKFNTLDISHFNTSKVTNMEWMFQNGAFTSLDLHNWDVSHVTDMKDMFRGCSKVKTLNVAGWNTANVEYMSGLFYGCNVLKTLDLSSWNTSKITNTSSMFWNCNDLSTLTLGNGWDMSHVTSMEYMFYGCEDLGNALDVSSWNTANVTSLYQMFKGCTFLYSLDVSNWNTDKVTDMSYMFDGCQFINTLDVSNWNTDKVTKMRYMFNNCYNLNSLNVSGWNTSNVENMNNMFGNCRALSALDVSGWQTGKVSNMSNMFVNCSTLPALDISNWDMHLVSDVEAMFSGCNLLGAIDLSGFNSCTVSNMNSMFKDCKELTSLNLRKLFTGNVTDMGSLFSGCTLLKDVYVSNLWQTRNVTNDTDMFTGCEAIVGEEGTTYDAANVTKDYAHYAAGGYLRNGGDITLGAQPYAIYDADGKTIYLTYSDQMLVTDDTFTPDGTSTPVTVSNIWYGDAVLWPCTYTYSYATVWAASAHNATKVAIEPSFSQVRPQTTASWFSWMEQLETVSGMENLVTSDVTSMRAMFYECYALKDVDVSHFDTQNVTDMDWMFSYCSKLESLDVSGWNTANVEHMNIMFSDCDGLKSLDLSGWNTSKVKGMNMMFESSDNLKAVFVGDGWNTDAVEESEDMFYYCLAIIGEDGTTLNEATAIDKTVAHSGAGGLLRRHHDNYMITIPASGIASFSASENVTVPSGLTAHYCTTYDSEPSTISVKAFSGSVIPAETGVLLRGTAGETYTLTATSDDVEAISGNALAAVTVPTHIAPTDGDYTNFMLKSGEFIKIADSPATNKMPANKAYLQILTADLSSTSTVRGITLNWDDETATGIMGSETLDIRQQTSDIYDLQGRRVQSPIKKGLYIIGNKKVSIK